MIRARLQGPGVEWVSVIRTAADSRRQSLHLLVLYTVLAAFFAISLKMQLQRYAVGALPAASIYACLLLLFGIWLAPGFAVSRAWLAVRLRGVWRARCSEGDAVLTSTGSPLLE